MPHGIVYHAADGRITDAIPAAQRILRLTLEQLQGRSSADPRREAAARVSGLSAGPEERRQALDAWLVAAGTT